jgi:hypothetical protein
MKNVCIYIIKKKVFQIFTQHYKITTLSCYITLYQIILEINDGKLYFSTCYLSHLKEIQSHKTGQ